MSLKASTIISPILEDDGENQKPDYFMPQSQSFHEPKSYCSNLGSTQSSIYQRTSFGMRCPGGSSFMQNQRISLRGDLNSLNTTGTNLRVLEESRVTEVFSKIH